MYIFGQYRGRTVVLQGAHLYIGFQRVCGHSAVFWCVLVCSGVFWCVLGLWTGLSFSLPQDDVDEATDQAQREGHPGQHIGIAKGVFLLV